MGKRKCYSLKEESVDAAVTKFLDEVPKLLDLIDEDQRGDLFEEFLRLKSRLLTEEDGKAAEDFTLAEVVWSFDLNFTDEVSAAALDAHMWKIEENKKFDFPMTPCFASVVENYSKNFDRSSKAGCRAVLDLLLNECLTVLKGNHVEKGAQETSDRWQKSPTSFSDIRVYSEVTFNHKVLPVSKTQQSTSSPAVTVHGRLDYGIGRVLVPTTEAAAVRLRSRFQCLLVIVEATAQRAVGQALPQLLLYLACLRQSRVQRRRTNASVYGVASDGYIFIFVQITHDGTVLISRNFNIQLGDMLEVLQWQR